LFKQYQQFIYYNLTGRWVDPRAGPNAEDRECPDPAPASPLLVKVLTELYSAFLQFLF